MAAALALLCQLRAGHVGYAKPPEAEWADGIQVDDVAAALNALFRRPVEGEAASVARLRLFGWGVLEGLVPVNKGLSLLDSETRRATIGVTPGTVLDARGCVVRVDSVLTESHTCRMYSQRQGEFERNRASVLLDRLKEGDATVEGRTVSRHTLDAVLGREKKERFLDAVRNAGPTVGYAALYERTATLLKETNPDIVTVVADAIAKAALVPAEGRLFLYLTTPADGPPALALREAAAAPMLPDTAVDAAVDLATRDPNGYPLPPGSTSFSPFGWAWKPYEKRRCPAGRAVGAVCLGTFDYCGKVLWVVPDAREDLITPPAVATARDRKERPSALHDLALEHARNA